MSVVPQIEGRRCRMVQVLPGENCYRHYRRRDSEEDCAAGGLGHGGCAHLGHHAATEGVAVRREDRTRAFAAPATLNIWQPLAFAL